MRSVKTDSSRYSDVPKPKSAKITLGIDGYIDEVWQIVETRDEAGGHKVFGKMKDFGEMIVRFGEGGFSNEIIRKRRAYGGFVCNTANALINLGFTPALVGAFGANELEAVFLPFADKCRIYSVCAPAVTNIYEFTDGKIMLPYVAEILGIGWQTLKSRPEFTEIAQTLAESDIIGIGYWMNMPYFDEIIREICALSTGEKQTKRFFFDFADLRAREFAELKKTLHTISELNAQIPVTLSLNEHEAGYLFARLGEAFSPDMGTALEAAVKVREKTGLDEIVVHTPYFAVYAGKAEQTAREQRYCRNPVRTTGAGDTFNGGYIAAMAEGLSADERLSKANAATVFFVRNGYAPNESEIAAEIDITPH